MKTVSRGKQCTISLAPTQARSKNGHILRHYSILEGEGHQRVKLEKKKKQYVARETVLSARVEDTPPNAIEDPLLVIDSLDTESFPDKLASDIFHPSNSAQYAGSVLASAIENQLMSTVSRVSWNQGVEVQGWANDFRFLGQWWLTIRLLDDALVTTVTQSMDVNPETDMYKPFLTFRESRRDDKINQYIANIALRVHGRLFHFNLLHMDRISLTPDRMHVLWYEGLVPRSMGAKRNVYESVIDNDSPRGESSEEAEDEGEGDVVTRQELEVLSEQNSQFVDVDHPDIKLDIAELVPTSSSSLKTPYSPFRLTTISFSICNIGAASLAVLLSALITASGVRHPVLNLDLSYNAILNSSLAIFALMLPLTKVRRLSLRGNNLFSYDGEPIRDFLVEGCYFIEELDLSSTNLSEEQLRYIIDFLPKVSRLRVIHLNGLFIPDTLIPSVVKVILQSRSLTIRVDSCSDRLQAAVDAAQSSSRSQSTRSSVQNHLPDNVTFFEQFYLASKEKGWEPPSLDPIAPGYREFTTNDPSLANNLY